ncbi:quaternary amine ABC transporter ATP-binding protein [Bosea sp. TAF32]|uniref:quaternary amine ABC transporter ATP-binding protein n=1 Tax=Bosea sp. TAF32 TaxID=3237482 RepID=UPI003F927B54
MAKKLEVDGLTKVYGARPEEALALRRDGRSPREILAETGQMIAVSDVSFSVAEGEIFTIMGLSGSGKSTLVRCLNRLIEPTSGTVLIDGENILAKPKPALRAVRRSKIAMVFQNFALLPHKTVQANVEFGLMLRGESASLRTEKGRRALDQVGLGEWGARYPDNLSGGMRQRVGLARALASDPDILLMDEPFSALDPLIRSELQQELLKLQRDIKKTIIFITHDFHEAVRISDRLAVMRDGRFVQVGTPQDIVLRPVDDYVSTFARELDRAKMLRVGDLAPMRVPVVAHDAAAEGVRQQMLADGCGHAVLIAADRTPMGYVRLADFDDMLNGQPISAMPHRSVASTPVGSSLSRLYTLFNGTAPVAVLDEKGHTLGAVDACDVVEQLRLVAQSDVSGPATQGPDSKGERP